MAPVIRPIESEDNEGYLLWCLDLLHSVASHLLVIKMFLQFQRPIDSKDKRAGGLMVRDVQSITIVWQNKR